MTRDEMIRTATAMLNEKHAHAQRIGVEQVIDIMISVGALTPEPEKTVQPWEGVRMFRFHWLREPLKAGTGGSHTNTVAEWHDVDGWTLPGMLGPISAKRAHELGYRYTGPVSSITLDDSYVAITTYPRVDPARGGFRPRSDGAVLSDPPVGA